MNNSLYAISDEIMQLMEAADAGDIPEEAFADTLECLEMEFDDKVDELVSYLKDLAARSAAIQAEEKNLAERRKIIERKYDRIKTYVADAMLSAGVNKFESARNRITFRRSEGTIIDDEAGFIAWAMTDRDDLLTYPAPKINLTAVKKAIQNGEKIDGARVEEKQNMQIK